MEQGTIVTIIEGIEVVDALIAAAGFGGIAAVSETLPHIKKIKANSTFQLCLNMLKSLAGIFINKSAKK